MPSKIMADLDAVGNTTKAITKGVAIGSAVIAAVSLFGSFLVDVSRAQASLGMPLAQQISATGIRIDVPQVFVGMLIGGAIPWLFSSFAIQAVSRAASLIVLEVRRQFKAGVLKGHVKPDYRQAVEISTAAAQKELVGLALLGVVTPVVVGLVFKVEAAGRLSGGHHRLRAAAGGVHVNNAGGAWDNAKKLIEDEPRNRSQEHWQGLRAPQGGRRRRHGRRSVEGHRRPGAQPHDQGREPRLGHHRAHRRPVRRRNRHIALHRVGGVLGADRRACLGHHEVQGSGQEHDAVAPVPFNPREEHARHSKGRACVFAVRACAIPKATPAARTPLASWRQDTLAPAGASRIAMR